MGVFIFVGFCAFFGRVRVRVCLIHVSSTSRVGVVVRVC